MGNCLHRSRTSSPNHLESKELRNEPPFHEENLPLKNDLESDLPLKNTNKRNQNSRSYIDTKTTKNTEITKNDQAPKSSIKNSKTLNINQKSNAETKRNDSIKNETESAGLINFNNNCYFNSVLQVLAHCPDFIDDISIKNIQNLLKLMRDRYTKAEVLKENLREVLISFSPFFRFGLQHDPKELLSRILNQSRNNPFEWSRRIVFKENVTNHEVLYPDQKYLFFQYSVGSGQLSAEILRDSFSQFFKTEKKTYAHCEKCNKSAIGDEKMIEMVEGKYIIFNSFSKQSSCNLSEIETIYFKDYQLQLSAILMRDGNDISSGHNYTICREKNGWYIYNDLQVNSYKLGRTNQVYLIIYKIIKLI